MALNGFSNAVIGFHEQGDVAQPMLAGGFLGFRQDTEFTYVFENFFHPLVGELIERLNKESLAGLLDPQFHESLTADFFGAFYNRLTSKVVQIETFPKEIDVRPGGPYSVYNWELLFHIPLAIAVHLSKNQRFAEAQRWFHFIFDPTCNDTSVPGRSASGSFSCSAGKTSRRKSATCWPFFPRRILRRRRSS